MARQPIRYSTLTPTERNPYLCINFERSFKDGDARYNLVDVICRECGNVVILEQVPWDDYNQWLSVAEQEHIWEDERHLLWRLGK